VADRDRLNFSPHRRILGEPAALVVYPDPGFLRAINGKGTADGKRALTAVWFSEIWM
jgi:hypothetical protein